MNGQLLWIGLVCWMALGTAHAQGLPTVQGIVQDSAGLALEAATVVLLALPDSVVAVYSLTDANGGYSLRTKKGRYALQVSYLGYQKYSTILPVPADTLLPPILLAVLSDTLALVEVTAEHLPVQMRGDTLSFNSAAFKVRSHDDAGALLRQLPGLTVQEDGTILFNGQKVTEVLVDGKVFFDEDAQATLRTLSADAIKKIDITDTNVSANGVEPEEDQKTINLRLKKKAKTGLAGSVNAGYGYNVPPTNSTPTLENFGDHRYRLDGSMTYFTPDIRSAAYVRSGNVVLTNPVTMTRTIAPGITRKNDVGATFNWVPTTKTTWNSSYRYSQARTTLQRSGREVSILPDQAFERLQEQEQVTSPASHHVNSTFTHKFEKKYLLRVRLRAHYSDGRNSAERLEETREEDRLQNSLRQDYERRQLMYNLVPNLTFEKRFAKKDRQLIVNATSNWSNSPSSSSNLAFTNLYTENGLFERTDSLLQEQEQRNRQQNYSGSVLWKEPLSKKDQLHLTLQMGIEGDRTAQLAFDLEAATRLLNAELSNRFQRFYNYQMLVASWRHKAKVHRLEVTGGLRRSQLRGESAGIQIRQELYLPTGQLQWRYTIAKGKKVSFNYNLYLVEMTLSQLQPFVNNDDPLAIRLGNTNLRPAMNHRFTGRLDWFEQSNFTNFYLRTVALLTTNTILQQQTLDSTLRFIYQPVNAGLSQNISVDIGYNRFFQVLDLVLDVSAGGNRGQQPFLLNDEEQQQYNYSYHFAFKLSNKKKKVIDWGVQALLDGGLVSYENEVRVPNQYLNQYYGGHVCLDFLKRWELQTTLGLSFYSRPVGTDDPTVLLFGVSLKRRFLKNEQLEVELSGENLLNETVSWQRNQQGIFLTEQRTQSLGRYVLLSLRYKFRKSG